MRLIDADKLEDHEEIIPLGNGMYESTFIVYKDDIDEQPTVDAIPIEYIRKWVLAQGYGRKQGWLITLRNFTKLIKDWEAENNHGTS